MKNLSRFLLNVALLLVVIGSPSSHGEQTPESVPQPVRIYGIRDVIESTDGNVQFLSTRGPCDISSSAQQKQLFQQTGNTRKSFLRLFKDPEDPKAFLSVAWMNSGRNNGLGIYRFKGKEQSFVTHIDRRLRAPKCFQSPNGHIFITSRNGYVFWWDGEHLATYDLRPKGVEPNPSQSYREVQFVTTPGGPTCCYSIADPRYHKRALFDLLVFDDEGMRRISLKTDDGKNRQTGPACMPDANIVRMLFYNRWLNIDLAGGKVTEQPFDRPGKDKVKPVDVVALPDGTLLSLWRKLYRSPLPHDIDAFENGRYFRIAEWKNGAWEFQSTGLDRNVAKSHPHTIDDDGGWWVLTGDSTLVYRSPEGKWREFDNRYGLSRFPAKAIWRTGKWLWLTSYNNLARYDMDRLIKDKPQDDSPGKSFGDWLVYESQTRMARFANRPFRVQPLLGLSGYLVHPLQRNQKQIPLPRVTPSLNIRTYSSFLDSRDHLWMVSSDITDDVFRYKDGEWEQFSTSKDDKGNELTPLETASRKLITESWGPGDHAPRIAFGKEKTAVLLHGKIALLIEKEWKSISAPMAKTGSIEFENGDLILRQNSTIEFRLGASDLVRNTDDPPWEKRTISSFDLQQDMKIPDGDPISAPAFSRTTRFGQKLSVGGDQIAVFHKNHWTIFPKGETPFALEAGQGKHYLRPNRFRFQISDHGDLVIESNSRSMLTYAVLPGTRVECTCKEEEITVKSRNDAISPQWDSPIPQENEIRRYRIDKGPWSNWENSHLPIQTGLLIGKDHELEIQVDSRTAIVDSKNLKFRLNVEYDAQDVLEKLIAQLGASSFAEREKADREIREMVGPGLWSFLKQSTKSAEDPEIRLRLLKIVQSLEQSLQPAADPK